MNSQHFMRSSDVSIYFYLCIMSPNSALKSDATDKMLNLANARISYADLPPYIVFPKYQDHA